MIYELVLGALLINPAIQDSQPWPIYLDRERLRSEADSQVAQWLPCEGPEGTGNFNAEIVIGPTGKVQALDAADPLEPCWVDRLESLRFPAHAEEMLTFRISLITQKGLVLSIVDLDRLERNRLPAFLHVPMSLSSTQKQSLFEALGLASSPEAE